MTIVVTAAISARLKKRLSDHAKYTLFLGKLELLELLFVNLQFGIEYLINNYEKSICNNDAVDGFYHGDG